MIGPGIIEGDPPSCPYCGARATLESSAKVYSGRDYGPIWLCPAYPKCDSYVGCHRGTTWPLGRMANAQLRALKAQAHSAFDPLWQKKGGDLGGTKTALKKARTAGYRWLAQQLGMQVELCHIGHFDEERCRAVIKICYPYHRRK